MKKITFSFLLCITSITVFAEIFNIQNSEITQQAQMGFSIDGIGIISANKIASILFYDAGELYQQTGLKNKYRGNVFDRANEIINLAKTQQIKVSASGVFTYYNPSQSKKKINAKIDGAAFGMIFNAIKTATSKSKYSLESVKSIPEEEYDAMVKRYYERMFSIESE